MFWVDRPPTGGEGASNNARPLHSDCSDTASSVFLRHAIVRPWRNSHRLNYQDQFPNSFLGWVDVQRKTSDALTYCQISVTVALVVLLANISGIHEHIGWVETQCKPSDARWGRSAAKPGAPMACLGDTSAIHVCFSRPVGRAPTGAVPFIAENVSMDGFVGHGYRLCPTYGLPAQNGCQAVVINNTERPNFQLFSDGLAEETLRCVMPPVSGQLPCESNAARMHNAACPSP